MPGNNQGLNRRDFFGQLLGRWMRPAAKQAQNQLAGYLPAQREFLRPPGALPEREFLQTCFHCGNCVDSCPADAIQTYRGEDDLLLGTPFIDPERQPCVVCDSLACMSVCPSGALRIVDSRAIKMGTAIWAEAQCLRTQSENCVLCVEKCPLATKAITLGEEGQIQVQPGCIGCGVCQHHCPAEAIHVKPV